MLPCFRNAKLENLCLHQDSTELYSDEEAIELLRLIDDLFPSLDKFCIGHTVVFSQQNRFGIHAGFLDPELGPTSLNYLAHLCEVGDNGIVGFLPRLRELEIPFPKCDDYNFVLDPIKRRNSSSQISHIQQLILHTNGRVVSHNCKDFLLRLQFYVRDVIVEF